MNIYSKEFKDLVRLSKENVYIGTGNPASKILFIGKEAAINQKSASAQHVREIKNNFEDWQNNIKSNVIQENVQSWFEMPPHYNPLYPYKGQLNKVESRDSNGKVIRGHSGTSKTWYNYQKIIDNTIHGGIKSSHINFHQFSFCTEFNEITANYSNEICSENRRESIIKRKSILGSDFFKNFPVIIVAAGHYVRDHEIDLQKMFNVTFDRELSTIKSEGLNKKFLNIHFDNLNDSRRILIHTNQLSMVSNDLLNRISELIKPFLNF